MTRVVRRGIALFVAGALLAAGCSDDAPAAPEPPVPPSSSSASTTSEAPPSTTSAPAEDTVVDPSPAAVGAGGDPDPLLATDGSMVANGGGTAADFAAYLAEVAGTPADGPFYMVNLLDFAEIAHYPQGSDYAGSTGAEANQRYNAASGPEIDAVGGERVFIGRVDQILLGDGQDWDLVAIVRYPSRAALLELSSTEEFSAAVEHKWASLDNSFALVTETLDLGAAAELPPVDPATAPFPATDDDPPFVMFHLVNFHEEAQYEPGQEPDDAPISGAEAVDRYSRNAGVVAGPLGVRAAHWFAVIATAVTDGRTWDEARLNPFPSTATFTALTSDPTWAEGTFHRAAGIEDTYAMKLTPLIWERDLID